MVVSPAPSVVLTASLSATLLPWPAAHVVEKLLITLLLPTRKTGDRHNNIHNWISFIRICEVLLYCIVVHSDDEDDDGGEDDTTFLVTPKTQVSGVTNRWQWWWWYHCPCDIQNTGHWCHKQMMMMMTTTMMMGYVTENLYTHPHNAHFSTN